MKKLTPSTITIIPLAEEKQFLFRFEFYDSSPRVEFYTDLAGANSLVDGIRDAQRRYKIATAQLLQKRRKSLRVVKDDDV
jgi:hypothetical protein